MTITQSIVIITDIIMHNKSLFDQFKIRKLLIRKLFAIHYSVLPNDRQDKGSELSLCQIVISFLSITRRSFRCAQDTLE